MPSLRELIEATGISISPEPPSDIEIQCVSDDSRSQYENSLFIAVEGTQADGHSYIAGLGKNFVAAIGTKDRSELGELSIPYHKVGDSRLVLALLAHEIEGNPSRSMLNIGVTGTNGKTTVTYLIHYLLKQLTEQDNKKAALIGTTGIFIGDDKIPATHTTPSPTALAKLFAEFREKDVKYSVMEVSSHALHQKRTAGLAFGAAIFTNLTQDHLDYHGTMEEYARAKKLLFDGLGEKAIATVWAEDKWAKMMLEDSQGKKILVGKSAEHDYQIASYSTGLEGTQIEIRKGKEKWELSCPMIGEFNVVNISLAFATLNELGFDTNRIINALKGFGGVPGRMEIIRPKNKKYTPLVLVDYAHTPDALENALRTLKALPDGKQLYCVFGCGGDRDKGKRPLMGEVSSRYADHTIITNDNPRTEDPLAIAEEVAKGVNSEYKIIIDRKDAIEYALSKAESGDIVLIAGKGHEDYQVIGKEKIYFSDQQCVRDYYNKSSEH